MLCMTICDNMYACWFLYIYVYIRLQAYQISDYSNLCSALCVRMPRPRPPNYPRPVVRPRASPRSNRLPAEHRPWWTMCTPCPACPIARSVRSDVYNPRCHSDNRMITYLISSASRPRAATSVATRKLTPPSRKFRSVNLNSNRKMNAHGFPYILRLYIYIFTIIIIDIRITII